MDTILPNSNGDLDEVYSRVLQVYKLRGTRDLVLDYITTLSFFELDPPFMGYPNA